MILNGNTKLSSINIMKDKKQLRVFGFGFFVILTFIGYLFWNTHSPSVSYVLWCIASIFFICSIFFLKQLEKLYKPWMVFASFLAWFNTNLILLLTYFIVLMPIGIFIKIIGIRLLTKHPKRVSYWDDVKENLEAKNTSTINSKEKLMVDLLKEFLAFIKERKKFWLLPIIFVLLLLSGLIVMTQGSALAPFIYTLF